MVCILGMFYHTDVLNNRVYFLQTDSTFTDFGSNGNQGVNPYVVAFSFRFSVQFLLSVLEIEIEI